MWLRRQLSSTVSRVTCLLGVAELWRKHLILPLTSYHHLCPHAPAPISSFLESLARTTALAVALRYRLGSQHAI